ncbi:stalk domain-containing protein [Anaerotignum sp.]
MKKLFLLTLACILTLQTPVYADVIGPYLPGIFQKAKENGYIDLETKPMTLILGENSRTVESFEAVGTQFVPLRETAAFFGKTTLYNPQNKTVRLTKDPPIVSPASEITAGTKRFYSSNTPIFYENGIVNRQELHPLLPYSYTSDGITYIPLKALSEAFGYMYTFDYEANSVLLQQPVGLVSPVKISNAFSNEELKFIKQLQFLQEGEALYNNIDLQPYLKEIQLIENYKYNEPHYVHHSIFSKNEDALVMYEGNLYIYYTTHIIDWQDCVGSTFATLYQLNPLETAS